MKINSIFGIICVISSLVTASNCCALGAEINMNGTEYVSAIRQPQCEEIDFNMIYDSLVTKDRLKEIEDNFGVGLGRFSDADFEAFKKIFMDCSAKDGFSKKYGEIYKFENLLNNLVKIFVKYRDKEYNNAVLLSKVNEITNKINNKSATKEDVEGLTFLHKTAKELSNDDLSYRIRTAIKDYENFQKNNLEAQLALDLSNKANEIVTRKMQTPCRAPISAAHCAG